VVFYHAALHEIVPRLASELQNHGFLLARPALAGIGRQGSSPQDARCSAHYAALQCCSAHCTAMLVILGLK
jgi:hypothetical protein